MRETGEAVAKRGTDVPEAAHGGKPEGSAAAAGVPAPEPRPESSAGSSAAPQGTPTSLRSSTATGLDDEELATWAKNPNFHLEPAGFPANFH